MAPSPSAGALLSAREEEALLSFEMISKKEARVRQIVGASLWSSALAAFVIAGSGLLPIGGWAVWLAAGIMIHRMGQQSQ